MVPIDVPYEIRHRFEFHRVEFRPFRLGSAPNTERSHMNAVKVDRENLIATLTENRANHKAEFDQAIEGYKQQAADALREQADKVAEDADAHLYVSLPKPEDHTEDYDEVISMLTWSTEEQVEIGHTDFRNYVLDKWDWKARASATASLYNS